jgi:hypothetical protein
LPAIFTTESRSSSVTRWLCLALACCCVGALGCDRIRSKPADEIVYVEHKDAYLRDHVAAVSNRTGHVVNGEPLVVLEHGRRFLLVRDSRNESGWIEERYVVPQQVYDSFQELKQQSSSLLPVASATVRDDVALHLAPGRATDHLFMLKEGDKLQLLKRASTPKAVPAEAMPLKNPSPRPPLPASSKPKPVDEKKKKHSGAAAVSGEPTVPMEDWWLVRDAQNRVGWLLARRFDVDVPDTIAGYAENMRFVAVYTLTTVEDPDSGQPGGKVPVYLTLLAPYRDGLPYDFSIARVFSWNVKKHRYETAFRERDVWGYLPAVIATQIFPEGAEPTFTLRVSPTHDVTIDPASAMPHPPALTNQQYRMEGEVIKRVLPAGEAAAPAVRPAAHKRKRR